MQNDDVEGSDMLTEQEYESLALDALVRVGLTQNQALATLAERWPLDADGVLAECRGRGIALDKGALTAFLLLKFRRATFDDGTPLVADGIAWNRRIVNELLAWSIETGLARPGEPELNVADTIDLLRSEDQATRIVGGAAFSAALGAALRRAGATLEQFESLRPKLSATIGLAMAGGPDAAAALEALEALAADPQSVTDPLRGAHVTMADMLEGLRNPDVTTRERAAVLLTKSLAAGLALTGETREDVEYLVWPSLLALIERAVDGDPTAVDELEKRITNDSRLASIPTTVKEPSPDRVREEA